MNTTRSNRDARLSAISSRRRMLWHAALLCVATACMPFIPGRTPFPIDLANVVSVGVLITACGILLSDHFRHRENTTVWNVLTGYLLAALILPLFLIIVRLLLHGVSAGPSNTLLYELSRNLALPLLALCALGVMFALSSASMRRSALFWVAIVICVTVTWSVRLRIDGWYRGIF